MTELTKVESNWLNLVFSEYDNSDLAIQLIDEVAKDKHNLPITLSLWVNHCIYRKFKIKSVNLKIAGYLRYIRLNGVHSSLTRSSFMRFLN